MSTINLPPDTHAASIHLRVRNLDQAKSFYINLFGFVVQPGSETASLRLGASLQGPTLLTLTADPQAPDRPARTTGLYHVAYLLPDRRALGRLLLRLLQHRWPLQGAADHGVSEAVYLPDMEGNGIEIYIDRPQEKWPRTGDQLAMVSEPLDVDAILAEAGEQPWQGIDPGTRVGHIHLNVADLAATEHFYSTLAGFEVMQRSYPGALFLAAGGYHHHIGANTWNGRGAPPPPADAAGLVAYTIQTGGGDALINLRTRMESGGFPIQDTPSGFSTIDPSGIRVNFIP